MLTEICKELRNWFTSENDKLIGTFKIEDGVIAPSLHLHNNQYYRIIGSIFNDGVHESGEELIDEGPFEGAVWLMRIPTDVLLLNTEITDYCDKYQFTPYVSESFGGYSYSKAIGKSGKAISWIDAFEDKLKLWRKI